MGLTVDQVAEAINDILGPGADIDLALEGGKITGFVAHPSFSSVPVPERREKLWEALRARFKEDATRIGVLLLYSPEEYREMAS